MSYPIYGMFRDAKAASREHEEDCPECQVLTLMGDHCPEGMKLLTRAQSLYDGICEGPEYDKYERDE